MNANPLDRMRLIDKFAKLLTDTATERKKRPDWVKIGDEEQPAWVFYEREVMHAEVNRERSARGLGPLTLLDVRRVERWAQGHSDYGHKYAIYCTELAVGDRPVR